MAITNHERVGKALDLLKDGLQPFVEREMKAATCANVARSGTVVSSGDANTSVLGKRRSAVGFLRVSIGNCGGSGYGMSLPSVTEGRSGLDLHVLGMSRSFSKYSSVLARPPGTWKKTKKTDLPSKNSRWSEATGLPRCSPRHIRGPFGSKRSGGERVLRIVGIVSGGKHLRPNCIVIVVGQFADLIFGQSQSMDDFGDPILQR